MSQAPVLPLTLPLTVTFPCRPARDAPARRHPVVIRADWTMDTGHDERLERIAAALGSSVSCIPALAQVLPAFRTWWQRATRLAGLVIRSDDLGHTWRCADGHFGCCPANGFADPERAGAHAREARHVAAATGADRRNLVALVAGLGAAADPEAPFVPGSDPSLASLVERGWAAGLAADQVVRTCRELARHGCDPDLPTLLGLAQTGAQPAWVASAALSVSGSGWAGPDGGPDSRQGLLRWLAWTATDLDAREPLARARWLATGARRADIVCLAGAGYQAGAAAQVADGWGISAPGAAQVLARWVSSGYRPHPAHLVALQEVGLAFPPGPPAATAVTRLAGLVGEAGTDTAVRTSLALALVRHGTLHGAAVALVRARGSGTGATWRRRSA